MGLEHDMTFSHVVLELLHNVLGNEQVTTALVMVVVSFLGYTNYNIIKLKHDKDNHQKESVDLFNSNKRSALRNEYLQIYNSKTFTNEQKYFMTRKIIEDYNALKGNSYLHELDTELTLKAEEKPDEIE